MRQIIRTLSLSLMLLGLSSISAAAGELIDGVVASVNRTPILLSEWDEAICFESFMQRKPLNEVSDADRASALQRLIDRQLLELQIKGETVLQPSAKELQAQIAKVRAQIPGATDDARWREVLRQYGISERQLERQLKQQVEVMNFIDVRLRPAIHISSEEVETYYRDKLLPDLRSNGQTTIALADASPKIRELLTQQQMDEMLDAWLHNLRQQAIVATRVPLPIIEPDSVGAGQGGK